MSEAYICDLVRTSIGRFGGALSSVRADDLVAVPLRALMARNSGVDWHTIKGNLGNVAAACSGATLAVYKMLDASCDK